jgi:hypothetical protein
MAVPPAFRPNGSSAARMPRGNQVEPCARPLSQARKAEGKRRKKLRFTQGHIRRAISITSDGS